MTGRELSRPFVEYSSDWVRANVRPPQPIGERMMDAPDKCPLCGSPATERAPDHVWAVPFAECDECGCNAPIAVWNTRPLTGGVTAEMVRLVVAARAIAFGGLFDGCGEQQMAAIRELDEASEAFAATVPWTDEP
jgi:ribosomal protein L37AE/L43A